MIFQIYLKPKAQKDFNKLSSELKKTFGKHFEKLAIKFRPKKHLKHGLPYFIEKVTDSARFPFEIEDNLLIIIRCFKNHKEYEDWFNSKKHL
jgi:hypothetical protein